MKNKVQKIPIIDVKKYGGKQVAILGGKIIASGKTLNEVIRRAKCSVRSGTLNEVRVFSVPKTLSVIYSGACRHFRLMFLISQDVAV